MRTCICGREIVGMPGKMYCGVTCRRRAARARERENDPNKREVKVTPVVKSEAEIDREMYCTLLDNPNMKVFIAARDVAVSTNETRPIRILNPSEDLVNAFDMIVDLEGHVSFFPND